MSTKNYIPPKRHFLLKKMSSLSLVVLILMLNSCISEDDNPNNLPGINFGASTYYDSFLFSKSSNDSLTKTIKINFNDHAQDNEGFADLYFVDEANNVIGSPDSPLALYINNNEVSNGIIQLTSSPRPSDSLEIKLLFNPSENSRDFSGFLMLQNGKIERINNIEIQNASGIELFKWNARQEVVMNPLKKGLIWFLVIVAGSLLIWFLLIRNRMYPKMARGQIILNSPYYKSIRTKGVRQIIFTNHHYKQSGFNKLFAGEIIYEKNDFWQDEIKLSPARRRQLRIKMPGHYNIDPFTSKIDQGQSYKIKGNNEEVKFSFL